MQKIKHTIGALILCAALVAATVATAAGPPDIQRWIVAGGGGQGASGPLLLRATAGQGSAGVSTTGGIALCVGFWCAGLPGSNVYLPLVMRS